MRRLLIIYISCLLLDGVIYAYNDGNLAVTESLDSIEYMSLKKLDVVVSDLQPDPYQSGLVYDFLKTASTEEIQRSQAGMAVMNFDDDYSLTAVSGDNTEYAVGQIPYLEDVTPSGARIYNVPIIVSPISDFTPQISLQYNSQAGNGLAGYGWNIAGLSSIVITNKNQYYHGKTAAANVSDIDAVYSLDGVPLVVNDDATLAADYPLETAKGHIIVKKHMSGDVIAYFTALYPDGSKATFGMTTNTYPKTVYPITLLEDRLGNQIVYNYSCSNSDYRVSTILLRHKTHSEYSGILSFTYSERTDYHARYYAGVESYQNYILKSITSVGDGSWLRSYRLIHELRDGVNQLTSIECNCPEGEQLRPLCFTYDNDASNNTSTGPDISKNDRMFLSQYFSSTDNDIILYRRGKFLHNSYKDGFLMLPHYSRYDVIDTTKTGVWPLRQEHYQYGSRYAADQVVLVASKFSYVTNVDDSITVGEGFQYIDATDVNGDGIDEIVKVNFNGTSTSTSTTTLGITVYACNSSTGVPEQIRSFDVSVKGIMIDDDLVSPLERCYHFGDFIGTGKAQLLTISYNKDKLNNPQTSNISLIDLDTGCEISETAFLSLGRDDELFCIDLDGDGRTELCHAASSGVNIYNCSGTYFTLTRNAAGLNAGELSSSNYHFTDINGDGYVDLAREPVGTSTYWYFYQYTGESFVSKPINLQGKAEDDKYMFFDINNDGLADLIKRNGNTVYIYLNENANFVNDNCITSTQSVEESSQFLQCNIQGYNSMSDLITIEDHCINLYKFSQNLSAERLMTRFTNSLGSVTINCYADMSGSDSVYLIDASRTYSQSNGYAKCRFPLQLLYNTRRYLSSSQTESSKLTDLYYTYFDACVHTKGLGFCGFGKVRTTNFRNTTDKELVTIETRNPENMGVTTRLVHGNRMTQDDPYNITDYSYDTHTTTYGKLNPRLTKEVNLDTLTNITTTTSYTYGDFDYPKTVAITYGTGTRVEAVNTHSYEYEHKNTAANYVLGALTSDLKANIIPSQQKFWYEKLIYTYNDLQLPVTCVEYIGASTSSLNKKRETRWTYDTYGNILSEMVAPYNATEFIGKTYSYDSNGINLQSITNELGQITTFANYNKFGKPLIITDHKGRVTTDEYDYWGKLISRTMPDGTVSSTTEAWGGIGCYTVTSSSSGKPKQIVHYDAAGREVRSGSQRYNGLWLFTDRVYGRNGQIQKVSLPFKSTLEASLWNTYTYDEYLRPVSYTQASGNITTWAYDDESTTESKNGVWSIKTVDSKGQVVKVQDGGGTIKYTLRADGQPSEVEVSGGLSTTFEYDSYGRRVKIVDPSAGTQTDNIVFNSDGSSVSTHTNPNGTIITYSDKYGRTTKVERPGEYTTDYVYNADGLLTSETSSNGTSMSYTYDGYDRVLTMTETVPDGKWLKKTYTYTTGSNVNSIAYESQNGTIATENFAYSNGTNIRIGLQDTHIRLINGENEFGQPTSVATGGITRTYSYNAYGMPTRRTMGTVMDYSYSFDPLKGNLMSRTDNLRNQTETFGYDALNRLTVIDDREITYSDNGNITSIDSVGDMTYDNSAKPYQVTSLTLEDDVVPSRVQNVTYTCYSRPSIMTEGGRSAAFTYNGDGARVKMNVSDGATSVLSRYYIGNQYELDVTPNGTTERLYLGGDAYSAPAVYVKEGSGTWTFYNIGRDYLGNITHIATSDGTLVEENSYDPWGRLRNPETKEIYSLGTEPELMLGRGYTGHEHLTWFGLINMNARLYDPVLGRFLSPDPFVQMPDFTQNFNRYSYCLNNPLVYVDENGELWWLVPTIVAGCFAIFNTVAHAINGDIRSGWNGVGDTLKYLAQGAITGAAIGLTWQFAPQIPYLGTIGKMFQTGMSVYAGLQVGIGTIGMLAGANNGGWSGVGKAAKMLLGNFYLDENSFLGGIWQGYSRHVRGGLQNFIGQSWSMGKNIARQVDRVDYFGGITYSTDEWSGKTSAVSLGGYIHANLNDEITSSNFRDYVLSNPTYMHEYGHTIDSTNYGLWYLFAIGIPSAITASNSSSIPGYSPLTTHKNALHERSANKRASKYFSKFGINWTSDALSGYSGKVISDMYPINKVIY